MIMRVNGAVNYEGEFNSSFSSATLTAHSQTTLPFHLEYHYSLHTHNSSVYALSDTEQSHMFYRIALLTLYPSLNKPERIYQYMDNSDHSLHFGKDSHCNTSLRS